MRINWFKQLLLLSFLGFLFYLAAAYDPILTMRGMSMGEPDLMLFCIVGFISAWLSLYMFYQVQREVTAVLVTLEKRISIHNIDEFDTFTPPQKAIEFIKKDEKVQNPDLVTGQYSVYIGEGIRLIRSRGSGETVIVIAPTPLISKHGDFVDCLANTKSYVGLNQFSELPNWVMIWCTDNIPGFAPGVTEIIYGDQPHSQAVKAWDLDNDRAVWTRGTRDSPVNFALRITYLKDLKKLLETEVKARQRATEAARKARTKPKKETPPPEAQQQNQAKEGVEANA